MAGTIIADTLTHSTAGSIATNYVVEGSAKCFSVHGVDAVLDQGLNVTSITDQGTGSFDTNYTNSFSSGENAFISNQWGTSTVGFTFIRTSATSYHRVNAYNSSGTAHDKPVASTVHGDLA